MRVLLVVLAVLAVGAVCTPIVSQNLINAVNSHPAAKWKAGVNKRFEGMSDYEFRSFLGTRLGGSPYQFEEVQHKIGAIPDHFDARAQWPACVGAVRDQGQCGSCWAFGAVEAISDRFCIQGGKSSPVLLSTQDMTSCDHSDGGCNGGWLESAWSYLQSKGVVTETCYPYELPPCHHPCGTPLPTPSCKSTCKDGRSFSGDKHFAKNVYAVRGVSNIQTEIMTNGPVEAAFHVYGDFPNYKSGVYHHVSGSLLGGHAIEIIGWGVESGTPYWLVKNSWNTEWGDNGLFKILRGSNECNIEGNIVAGMAKL